MICPNCVTSLKKQKKKLGGCSNWFVCPDCGYRERPIIETFKYTEIFCKQIKYINNNNYFKEI